MPVSRAVSITSFWRPLNLGREESGASPKMMHSEVVRKAPTCGCTRVGGGVRMVEKVWVLLQLVVVVVMVNVKVPVTCRSLSRANLRSVMEREEAQSTGM